MSEEMQEWRMDGNGYWYLGGVHRNMGEVTYCRTGTPQHPDSKRRGQARRTNLVRNPTNNDSPPCQSEAETGEDAL